MRSPFPGMDPWLEFHWRDVHSRLVVYAGDQIQAKLPKQLIARIEEGVSIDYGEQSLSRPRSVAPDVSVVEHEPAFEDGGAAGGVATLVETEVAAEPVIVPAGDDVLDRHVTIIDPSSGNRVVTAIEFLSPSNKRIPGQLEYARKQQEYLAGGVNLVEIDLVRGGDFTLAVHSESIPHTYRTPYQVCVRRATSPREAEIYRVPFRDKLPAIRIPLRPTDRDIRLGLQSLIDQCYERGRYDLIDYTQELIPPLPAGDAQWVDDLLRAAGRRK
ncbi:MAG: DUF4058 family protein [Planctomycetales bacterium]